MLGGTPPRSISQPLLRRLLAWEVQAKAQGGLPWAVRAKIENLRAAQAKGAASKARSPRLKPGGRLLREWNGVTHVVDVVEGGFLWHGTRHRSLSAITRAITGAHWSGPRFFGLKEADSAKPTGAAKVRSTAQPKASAQISTPAQPARARRAA